MCKNKDKVILIITHNDNLKPLRNILLSIGEYNKYPIEIHINRKNESNYELGGLKRIYDNKPQYKEIFILQDTFEVKDNKIFDRVFEEHNGKSVFINQDGQMYCCKYRRDVLDNINIPLPRNKIEAINYELEFNNNYRKLDNPIILFPNFVDSHNKFEDKFGRRNMIIENKYLKKYKGTWSPGMVKEDD